MNEDLAVGTEAADQMSGIRRSHGRGEVDIVSRHSLQALLLDKLPRVERGAVHADWIQRGVCDGSEQFFRLDQSDRMSCEKGNNALSSEHQTRHYANAKRDLDLRESRICARRLLST